MQLEIKEVNKKITFKLDGKKLPDDSALWSYDTPNKFSDVMWSDIRSLFNGAPGEIQFQGREVTFNKFKKQIHAEMDNLNVNFIDLKTKLNLQYETELKQWFRTVLETNLLSEQEKESAKDRFDEALNNVFVVNVLARVSAGKSTLINSLLGQRLMPSNNNAETAKITQIIDNDNAGGFTAVALDDNHNQMYQVESLSPQNMDALNDDPNVASVELTGDIPFAKSIDYALELVDTPGPDNVMNKNHRLQLDKLITKQNKNGFKPVVIYVISSNAIGTESTDELLDIIKQESKIDYQESTRNRFIFVISKMDTVKSSNVIQTIENAKNYLTTKGIENPVIIPVSAELALNIRRSDINDEDELEELDFKTRRQNKHPEFHFDELAVTNGVSNSTQSYNDERLTALKHSGIPTLEDQIRAYINDFAAPERLARLNTLTNNILSEKAGTTSIIEDFNSTEKSLNQVEYDFEIAKGELDDKTNVLQEKQLVNFKNVKEGIRQLISEKDLQLSGFIGEKFRNFNPSNNVQRSERLNLICKELVETMINGSATLETELKDLSEKHNFKFPDIFKTNETTKRLLQQGLIQSANITAVDDEDMDSIANKKTIEAIRKYCEEFQSDFTNLLQQNLLIKLEQAEHNLAKQIKNLTDYQRQQQSLIDKLVQKRSLLTKRMQQLTVAKKLLNTKPTLKEEE